MFTNTLKLSVTNQLDNRSRINSNPEHYDQSGINWLNRTPFVFAYSNLRYGEPGTSASQVSENMKWSVLSSFNVKDKDNTNNFNYQNYILQNKQGFYDFYENNSNFGIIPRPHITSLDVRGRGNNGTLKDVNLEIVCYDFEQFMNIRRYFSVPCTSIFLQFGYFQNIEALQQSVLPPLVCGYNQLTITDDRAQKSYLNMAMVYQELDNKQIVTADALICIVYGFDVTQQQGNIFRLRVNMMCKGNSEILNYIKPEISANLKFLNNETAVAKSEGKYEQSSSPAPSGATSGATPTNTSTKDSTTKLKAKDTWEPGHTVTSPYGNRINPKTKKYSMHHGIDISLRTGDALYAPYNGKVVAINRDDPNEDSGYYTIFEYQNGTTTRRVSYCHCSRISEGLRVNNIYPAGTILAYGGSTGRSTGPHLHITYRKNKKYLDPSLGDIKGKVFSPSGVGTPPQGSDMSSTVTPDSNAPVPQKLPDNSLSNYIRALSQRVNVGDHSIVLNTNGQRYVTFDWINYAIVYLLRKITISPTVSQSGQGKIPELFEPVYYFDIQQDYNAQFYSNTLDVAILPLDTKVGYSLIWNKTKWDVIEARDQYNSLGQINFKQKVEAKDAKSALHAKINDLTNLYIRICKYIEGQDYYNSYIKPNKFTEKIREFYIKRYIGEIQRDTYTIYENGILKFSKKPQFGYLGHIYFRLQSVLELIKNQEKLTLDGFMTALADKVSSATNRGIVCSTMFNHRTEKFLVSQHSLSFSAASNIYYIPNFGQGSIVKQITYNLKMPDGYKVTIFQAYGANGGIMNDLFKRMFNGDNPQDIYLYKGVPNGDTNTGEGAKVINYSEQKQKNKALTLSSISSNGKLSCIELPKESVTKAINLYNQAELMIQKDLIEKETGHRSVSSIYAIQVQLILDFIASIDWGEVFKLAYNPLGWQSKFYVSDVQYRVQPGNAETIIKGVMFG